MPDHVELAKLRQCRTVLRRCARGMMSSSGRSGTSAGGKIAVARPGRLDSKSRGGWSSLYIRTFLIPVGQRVRFVVYRLWLDHISIATAFIRLFILASVPVHRPLPGHRSRRGFASRSRRRVCVGQIGIPAAQGDPAVVARRPTSASTSADLSEQRTTNSLKNGPGKAGDSPAPPPAARRRNGLCEPRARQPGAGRWAHGRQVDAAAQGQQALVGADVRGRLFAADVLLAVCSVSTQHRLPWRSVVWPTIRPGQLAEKCFAAGHDAQVRPAEGHRVAQRLPFGHHDIGPVFARRLSSPG